MDERSNVQGKTVRVAALTSGMEVPSARFRVRQHVQTLKNHNIMVSEHCPAVNQHARVPGKLSGIRSRYLLPVAGAQVMLNILCRIPGAIGTYKADAVWLERSFVPGMEPLVNLTKSPRVLDVDDSVWLMTPLGEKSARLLARSVDAVIAGNGFLADWYSNYCKNIYIVPTAIDCRRFLPKPNGSDNGNDSFVIGWTGTSYNFKYLKLIEKPLARFLENHRQARLLIVAERKPMLESIPQSQFIFEAWTEPTEADILHKIDVGIMPLADDDWGRGKCGFKMLQYMATGIPVVVSNVGMNKEILEKGKCGFGVADDDEWYQCIETLFSSPRLRADLGKSGRIIVEGNYSMDVVSGKLAEVFHDVA